MGVIADPRLRTPREVRKALLKTGELSNRERWKFLVYLRALDEIRGWLAVGFSTEVPQEQRV